MHLDMLKCFLRGSDSHEESNWICTKQTNPQLSITSRIFKQNWKEVKVSKQEPKKYSELIKEINRLKDKWTSSEVLQDTNHHPSQDWAYQLVASAENSIVVLAICFSICFLLPVIMTDFSSSASTVPFHQLLWELIQNFLFFQSKKPTNPTQHTSTTYFIMQNLSFLDKLLPFLLPILSAFIATADLFLSFHI